MELYTAGFSLIFTPETLLFLVAGTVIGITIGALPGLTAMMAVSILIPMTYSLEVVPGVIMLLGVYCGANYGGSISATLINIPGTPSAVMTTLDAYPMAKKGQAGLAIGLATMASGLGGIFSVVVLVFLSPVVAEIALKFTSLEMLSIAIFGISVMAYISPGSIIKGLISGMLGLLIATIGFDPTTAVPRFTFGSMYLFSGVNFIAAMIGLFGLSEILLNSEKKYQAGLKEVMTDIKKPLECFKHLKAQWGALTRASVIGVIIGAIPGAGGTIASLVAYAQQKKVSKKPEEMGKGAVEGIIAAESANNACCGGAMTTLLSLGIPGDAVTAILIGAFIMKGLTPGPLLFTTNMDLVSAIFIGMFIINILLLVLGLAFAPYFAKLLKVPRPIMNTVILLLCVVGTFGVQNSMFDVYMMITFAIIGYSMAKLKLPRAPIVLSLILGPLMEENLRRWLELANGQYLSFFLDSCANNPIAPIILTITVLTLVAPLFSKKVSEDMVFDLQKEVTEVTKEKEDEK